MKVWPLVAAFALAPQLACLAVSHQARVAPLGDPASPALRADGVTTGDRGPGAGQAYLSDSGWIRPVVSADGMKVEAGDEIERTVLFSMRVAGVPDGRALGVLDMTWSAPSAPRCAGGHPALAILLPIQGPKNHWVAKDRQIHWERPIVVGGERVVTARFDEDLPLLAQPSVIDVRLVEHEGATARETCVRVSVTGPDVTYWSTKTWSVGGRLGWRRALAFSPGSVMLAGASFGRWVGPVRLAVEGLFGGSPQASLNDEPVGTSGLCFLVPGPNCDRVDTGGAGLEASGVAWRWSRWAVGWSLAFEALYAGIHRLDPAGGPAVKRHASSGGARLGVQLLRVPPAVMGVSRHSPISAWGLELYGAAAQTWTGTANGTPVTFGIAVLGF